MGKEVSGWIEPVWTEALDLGQPMLVLYAAAIEDRDEAVLAVKAFGRLMDDGDHGARPTRMLAKTVKALGLSDGQVAML